MSIENTLERIATALETLAGRTTQPAEAAPEKTKPARSAAKPSAKDTSSTADTSEETPSGEVKDEQSDASGTDDTPPGATLDYEAEVKPLILKIGAQKGRDAILALLKEYGVSSGQALTADQYEAFVASAKEVLG